MESDPIDSAPLVNEKTNPHSHTRCRQLADLHKEPA